MSPAVPWARRATPSPASSRTRTAWSRRALRAHGLAERRRGPARASGSAPCSAARAGRTKSWKVTIADTGLPGRPNASVPSRIAEPGRLARASGSPPRSAPPLRAPPSRAVTWSCRPYGHSAGDADHVGAWERPLQRRTGGGGVVARADAGHELGAGALHLGGERIRVRAVDPSRRQLLARAHQLVACHHQRHPGPHGAGERGPAHRRGHAELRRPQPRAGAEQQRRPRARPRRHGARSSPAPPRARAPARRPPRCAPPAPPRRPPRAQPPRWRCGPQCPPPRAAGRDGRREPPRRSAARPRAPATTAKPSIAELSKGGTLSPAERSSASTRPSARSSATPSALTGRTCSSTRALASAMASSPATSAIFSVTRVRPACGVAQIPAGLRRFPG